MPCSNQCVSNLVSKMIETTVDQQTDRLAEAWLARDFELARDMEQFLGRMNDYLDEVNIHRQNDVTEAYQGLRSALELFEQDFLTTKRALDELDVISSRL